MNVPHALAKANSYAQSAQFLHIARTFQFQSVEWSHDTWSDIQTTRSTPNPNPRWQEKTTSKNSGSLISSKTIHPTPAQPDQNQPAFFRPPSPVASASRCSVCTDSELSSRPSANRLRSTVRVVTVPSGAVVRSVVVREERMDEDELGGDGGARRS
jgi:hypothetical protein